MKEELFCEDELGAFLRAPVECGDDAAFERAVFERIRRAERLAVLAPTGLALLALAVLFVCILPVAGELAGIPAMVLREAQPLLGAVQPIRDLFGTLWTCALTLEPLVWRELEPITPYLAVMLLLAALIPSVLVQFSRRFIQSIP